MHLEQFFIPRGLSNPLTGRVDLSFPSIGQRASAMLPTALLTSSPPNPTRSTSPWLPSHSLQEIQPELGTGPTASITGGGTSSLDGAEFWVGGELTTETTGVSGRPVGGAGVGVGGQSSRTRGVTRCKGVVAS